MTYEELNKILDKRRNYLAGISSEDITAEEEQILEQAKILLSKYASQS